MEPACVFDRWCGFQVIDPTVAWILSRVGPTIRRVIGSYWYLIVRLTVVVRIPRLLAVVVSPEKYAAPPFPPLPYMSDKKTKLMYGYMIS